MSGLPPSTDSSHPTNLRILLVDDHRMLREGLRALLSRETGYSVVAEAGDGDGALKAVRRDPPDLIVLDVHLPDMSGIEVARRILAVFPEVKVIMLSSDHSHNCVHEALLAGVSGYVLKENAAEELLRAIHTVVLGQLYLCPEVGTEIIASYRRGQLPDLAPPTPQLSAREREVLKLLADGLRTKEIADQLGVSTKTAETYRHRLMEKLQLPSVAELTRYAIREGIVQA
jgi:two-component system NarL family response regulator